MKSVRNIHALSAVLASLTPNIFGIWLSFVPAAILFTQFCIPECSASSVAVQNSEELLQPNPLIRIGLMRFLGCTAIQFRAEPGAKLFSPDGTEKASGIGPWTLTSTSAGSAFLDSRGNVLGQAADGEHWRLQAELPETRLGISLPCGTLHHYHGAIEVFSKAQRLTIINEITLENYLRGVVPAEMGSNSPMEALKAQAVASRTYALYTLSQNNQTTAITSSRRIKQAALKDTRVSRDYDMRDDTQAQVYAGADIESKLSDLAVKNTAGWILTQAGKPFPAFYSSSCGGVTCPAISSDSLPRSVDDSEAHGGSGQHPPDWTIAYTGEKLATLLTKSRLVRGTAKISSLLVTEKDVSGRVKHLSILWEGVRATSDSNAVATPQSADVDTTASTDTAVHHPLNSKIGVDTAKPPRPPSSLTIDITGNTLRTLLGNDTLRSTLFEIRQNLSGDFIIEGRGWGHGKGMCQIGAKALASLPLKKNYRSILMHYYEGAELTHIVYSDEEIPTDHPPISNQNLNEGAH